MTNLNDNKINYVLAVLDGLPDVIGSTTIANVLAGAANILVGTLAAGHTVDDVGAVAAKGSVELDLHSSGGDSDRVSSNGIWADTTICSSGTFVPTDVSDSSVVRFTPKARH